MSLEKVSSVWRASSPKGRGRVTSYAATVAGSAGPGFYTWPFGPHPSRPGSEFASSHPVPCQKDVRRGVRRRRCSRVRWPRFPHLAFRPDPSRPGSESAFSHPAPCQKDVRRCVRRRDRGQRPTATKEPNPKQLRRRDAATVAGSAGPGFHNWPSGHIPQDPAPNPLFRIRPPAKKTFGEGFGAATGVSDPRLQKIRIRNNGAGGKAATVAGSAGPGGRGPSHGLGSAG